MPGRELGGGQTGLVYCEPTWTLRAWNKSEAIILVCYLFRSRDSGILAYWKEIEIEEGTYIAMMVHVIEIMMKSFCCCE